MVAFAFVLLALVVYFLARGDGSVAAWVLGYEHNFTLTWLSDTSNHRCRRRRSQHLAFLFEFRQPAAGSRQQAAGIPTTPMKR